MRKEVADVVLSLDIQLEASGGKIIVNDLPVIEASDFQMRQLFQNLIGNALKFRQKELSPVVNITSRKLTSGFWEISVADNGIGFDEKYAMIFIEIG